MKKFKEAGINPKENEDVFEAKEKFVEKALNHMLKKAEYHNEGNNGVIMFLDTRDFSKELLDIFDIEGGAENDYAIKVLKIYQAGTIIKEYEDQKKGYDLVKEQGDTNDFAKVPKPYLMRNVALSSEVKNILEKKGVNLKGNNVEMMVMDFVPGDDLATIIYHEVLRVCPDPAGEIKWDDKKADFFKLQQAVFRSLNMAVKVTGKTGIGEESYEERKLRIENAEKIISVVEGHAVFETSIINQIRNTLSLFKANGISLSDTHDRNFMIVGDPWRDGDKNNPPQAYIIDFGAVDENSKGEIDMDLSVLNRLERLSKNAPEKDISRLKNLLSGVLNMTNRLNSRTKTDKNWKEIEKAFKGENLDKGYSKIISEYIASGQTDLANEILVARFEMARQNGLISNEQAKFLATSFIEDQSQDKISIRNLLVNYINYIKQA